MLKIKKDTVIYCMAPTNAPVATAESGDTVIFETLDCFGEQIQDESQHLGGINWEMINPATGPLYVNGAEPGDTLKVEILKIELTDHGTLVEAPEEGITGLKATEENTKITPLNGDMLKFNDIISFPINPMIGVIGTAPKENSILTGTPDAHGGNMDCNRIGANTTLYLPVNIQGALLAMGDMHAVMGDGEVCVCGAEISGEITVKVTVIKGQNMPLPFLVTPKDFMTIYSDSTLDQAAEGATLRMRQFLIDEVGMKDFEAGMYLSLQGNLRICQAVDPEKTCRMEVPLQIVNAYGYIFK